MRCALAALGFINGDIAHNQKILMDTLKVCASQADLILFGESYLQGFYGTTFCPEQDAKIALSTDSPVITAIRKAAQDAGTAISFGFLEKAGNCFFSSQLTIDGHGNIADLYRRVSPGWKEPFAAEQYREGQGFHTFSLLGKQVVVALCGDLWFDHNVAQIRQLEPDLVLWPVYTDYTTDQWNTSIKHEYAAQAAAVCDTVLYVNSLCIDPHPEALAKGGAALFHRGTILREVPSGAEAILMVEI